MNLLSLLLARLLRPEKALLPLWNGFNSSRRVFTPTDNFSQWELDYLSSLTVGRLIALNIQHKDGLSLQLASLECSAEPHVHPLLHKAPVLLEVPLPGLEFAQIWFILEPFQMQFLSFFGQFFLGMSPEYVNSEVVERAEASVAPRVLARVAGASGRCCGRCSH